MNSRDYDAIARSVRGALACPDDAGNTAKTGFLGSSGALPVSGGAVAPDERALRIVADALWEGLHDKGVSWVGFYLFHPGEPEDRAMTLGPSRDTPACSPIGLHGVCGQAFTGARTMIVRDVRDLGDAYVACDPRDASEIVIPCYYSPDGPDVGTHEPVCWGVLDLDSHETGAFDESDEAGLAMVLSAAGIGVRIASV